MESQLSLGLLIRISEAGSLASLKAKLSKFQTVLKHLEIDQSQKISLHLSGFAFEALQSVAGLHSKLQKLVAAGQIEPVCGFHFEPPQWVDPKTAGAQLKLSVEAWKDLGASSCAGVFIPKQLLQSRFISLIEQVEQLDPRYLIVEPESAKNDTAPTIQRVNTGTRERQLFQVTVNVSAPGTVKIVSEAHLEELCDSILSERSKTRLHPLSIIRPDSSSPSISIGNDLQQAYVATDSVALLFKSRLQMLSTEIDSHSPEKTDALLAPKTKEHWNLADSNHMAAGTASAFESSYDQYTWKRFFELMLASQVYLDQVKHPAIDPNEGWIESKPHNGGLQIDTQLLRSYFNSSGELFEFDYKPRRINFAFPSTKALPSIEDGANAIQSSRAYFNEGRILKPDTVSVRQALLDGPHKVLKSTKGLLTFRFQKSISTTNTQMRTNSAKLFEEYSFHAGIGAHLNHSTTGFSVEFWIEDANSVSDTTSLVLEWDLMLTSADFDVYNAQVLLCVGGIAATRLPLATRHHIATETAPGGLYGIRLIDSVDDLTIDFRFSKPLSDVVLTPLTYQPAEATSGKLGAKAIGGVRMSCLVPAQRIVGDNKSYVMFVSIV